MDDDRNALETRVIFELLENGGTVHLRHSQIEQDAVRPWGVGVKRLLTQVGHRFEALA